jgi:Domain of unknown function (DUF4928)
MTANPTRNPRRRISPIKIRHKRQESIRFHIESLFLAVRGKKHAVTGEWQGLQLMRHLVAAVLSLKGRLDHDAVVSMSAGSASCIGNTVIHVTHCPEWPLMHECFAESDQGLRPLVISTRAGAAQAEALAQQVGMGRKVEVLDITQFLVANMLEWTGFNGSQRRHTFEELITRYNAIVEACETDPSLKIEVA